MFLTSSLLIIAIIIRVEGENIEKLRGKYSNNIDLDYHEITVPRKISEDGEFVTHYLPHFYDHDRPKRHLQGESVNYLVTVDNKDHHLQLWPSMDFIAPSLVVEHHVKDLADNISNIVMRQTRSNRCFYNGIIRGVPNSRVAISTCDGLSGFIGEGNGEHYLIEPVHEDDQPIMDEKQLHLVFKRSLTKDTKLAHTNCGTKGTFREAVNDRLRWENMYGKAVENSIRNSIYEHFLLERDANVHLPTTAISLIEKDHQRDPRKCTPCEVKPDCAPLDPTCEASLPLYLEAMVAIDSRIDRTWVGVDVETYILSIMNMVASNLADGSIGNPIRLNIVRIVLLTYQYPQLDILRYSPSILLQNFCDWQISFNPPSEDHPNHHDFAILVTRFEPCQGHLLGVTNMASICRPDKTCAVVSDEGLLLANIITHQIGHSLGADHDDGSSGGCAPEEPDGTMYFMGPVIAMSSSEWSICSRRCISEFVSTHVGWCLSDLPSQHDFKKPNILPGQIYSPIQQCSINFNMKSMACKIGEFCKALYCQISPNQCASTGDPPAPGTPCALNMWCFNGDCVQRGSRPGAVNGEWGPWSPWSPCTRSCGGGVQIRHRSCSDPAPLHGGKTCRGNFVSFKMCAINPCLGFTVAFGQLQCKFTDSRFYEGKIYSWDLFYHFFEEIECALICINEKKQVAIRSPVVVDGTPCKEMTRDVCVQGKCMTVGCDWVINSESKDDACGICHGNGTQCRVVQGFYNDANISSGLNPFLKLPSGTSMIFIREINPSSCTLVVTSSVNMTFYLNSVRGDETLPGLVNIAGTVGIYETRSYMERLYVQGHIRGPITVNVMCKDLKARGIRYQYALPEDDKYYIPKYNWEYVYWQRCDVPCGGGVQKAPPICVEAKSGEVEDKYCALAQKPEEIIRACSQFPCSARWWVGPWSNCDCTDGEGIQTRLVLCLRTQGYDSSRSKVVKERECCRQPKPRVEKPCSPGVEVRLAIEDKKERRKRQMGLLSYDENEEDAGSQSTAKSFTRTNELASPNMEKILNNDPFFNTEEEYEEILDQPLVDRRHKKLYPGPREKLRLHTQKLNLNDLLVSPLLRRRPVQRTRILNALMGMENEQLNAGLEKDPNKSAVLEHSMRVGNRRPAQLMAKSNNKLVKPPNSHGKSMPAINDTMLAQRKDGPIVSNTLEQDGRMVSANGNSTTSLPLPTSTILRTNSRGNEFSSTFCPRKVLPTRTTELTTACGLQQATEYEPADLPGWVESANSSSYRLILTPVDPPKHSFPETDPEFQVLGKSGNWPTGDDANQITLFGEQVLKALVEARKRVTKPPIVEIATD